MKKFTLIGHCNAGLSIVLDALFELYGENQDIEIVSNIKEEDNTERDLPFRNKIRHVNEIYFDKWDSHKENLIIVSNGSLVRRKIYDFFNKEFNIEYKHYLNLIYPGSIIPDSVKIAYGNLFAPGIIIAPFAEIGSMVNINRKVSIGHHSKLGDFVNLNPAVTVCGKVCIKDNVTVGAGATILDNINIGENTIIGAGSLVTEDIPENVIAYGLPAKIIKENNP